MSETTANQIGTDQSAQWVGPLEQVLNKIKQNAFSALVAVTALACAALGFILTAGGEQTRGMISSFSQDAEAPSGYEGVYVRIPQRPYPLARHHTKADDASEHYLLMSLALKTSVHERAAVMELLPEIEFVIEGYVRSLTPSHLIGSSGLYRLREGVLYRVQKVAGDDRIEDVFITEVFTK